MTPALHRRLHAASTLAACAFLLVPGAGAAPLDALLTALPELAAPRAQLEIGIDRLNRALDFSTSNEPDPLLPPPPSGNYRGHAVSAAVRAADGLWLSGALSQRRIDSGADSFRYLGWQLAGQYRFNEAAGAMPALALRLAAWGHRAGETASTTPVLVQGARLDTVTISKPSDRQLQADLLATWRPAPAWSVGAMLGIGRTQLRYGKLSATTQRNGCSYDLQFNGNDIFGNLIEPCSATGAVVRQFYDSSGDYGVDVANEIAWGGRFVQLGVNAAWRDGPWTLQGGWLYHTVKRDAVDDILASRGDPVHRINRNLTLEADYRFAGAFSVFVRSQASTNLFFNDLPVTYNSSTSDSFGRRYALFTLGLRASF